MGKTAKLVLQIVIGLAVVASVIVGLTTYGWYSLNAAQSKKFDNRPALFQSAADTVAETGTEFNAKVQAEFAKDIPGLTADDLKKRLSAFGFEKIFYVDNSQAKSEGVASFSLQRIPCIADWDISWHEKDNQVLDIKGTYHWTCP